MSRLLVTVNSLVLKDIIGGTKHKVAKTTFQRSTLKPQPIPLLTNANIA